MFIATQTQEDYLRAIYLLADESGKEVRVVDIVASLSLSKSTVTKRLQELAEKGWLIHEKYGPVILTSAGLKIASDLTYKHRIIEYFLCDVLGVEEVDVHEEAHKLEHAVSDTVIKKMAEYLNNPTHCPHGRKLPKFD